MVLVDAPSLLASSCKNDKSDKMVVKASCDFEHDMAIAFKDIFMEEMYSLEQTPLETLVMSRLLRSCPMI